MIDVCSFWFPEARRCPPKEWPVEVDGCDAAVPQNITGIWRSYALPVTGGFYAVDGGWAMNLGEESILFDFGTKQLSRSYSVTERGDRRYALELRNGDSATTAIHIELAPCGMLVEAHGRCDAFCENFTGEFGPPTEAEVRAMIAESFGGTVPEAELQRLLEEIAKRPAPSLFPQRAFFRAISSD